MNLLNLCQCQGLNPTDSRYHLRNGVFELLDLAGRICEASFVEGRQGKDKRKPISWEMYCYSGGIGKKREDFNYCNKA